MQKIAFDTKCVCSQATITKNRNNLRLSEYYFQSLGDKITSFGLIKMIQSC